MFNQLKAEQAVEEVFRVRQSTRSSGSTGELVMTAFLVYKRYMGIS
jgi:hypothetical protein